MVYVEVWVSVREGPKEKHVFVVDKDFWADLSYEGRDNWVRDRMDVLFEWGWKSEVK